jgi:FkbM family methyltransferase
MYRKLLTTGTFEQENGEDYVKVSNSSVGCVVWGPYESLGKGKYQVTFRIQPDADAKPDAVCCKIDVVKDLGHSKLHTQRLSVRDLRDSKGEIDVSFELQDNSAVEYRVFGMGNVGFRVAYDRSAKAILDDNSVVPVLASRESIKENRFFRTHYNKISYLAGLGVDFNIRDQDIVATVGGISFKIESTEDFQLIAEIFFINDYNFIPPRPCMAVDIGMNVGLTSLFMASNPHVEEIHSFEPFHAPRLRADRNFKMNPQLSSKIAMYDFGLSDKDEELDVFADDLETIGTSIKGRVSGRPEKIQLRDAGRELRMLAAKAKERGWGLVLKIDCEGSEFAILEALERDDLLASIDAFMIEWHKWWSKEKTQQDIIRPLTKAGHLVFDRTNPENPYAGMLLAVRTQQAS